MAAERFDERTPPTNFVGRTGFFTEVSNWWEHGQERYLILGGGVGAGKTSDLSYFIEWVELGGDNLIMDVLSNAALVDPELAVNGARQLCRKRPLHAVGRDTLRAIAITVSGRD
jgi:hypothetical protein